MAPRQTNSFARSGWHETRFFAHCPRRLVAAPNDAFFIAGATLARFAASGSDKAVRCAAFARHGVAEGVERRCSGRVERATGLTSSRKMPQAASRSDVQDRINLRSGHIRPPKPSAAMRCSIALRVVGKPEDFRNGPRRNRTFADRVLRLRAALPSGAIHRGRLRRVQSALRRVSSRRLLCCGKAEPTRAPLSKAGRLTRYRRFDPVCSSGKSDEL